MKAAGPNFPGVQYNDKKVKSEKGELMRMNNFPSFINKQSSKEDVKSYLASISKSEKVKKPQFHATISTRFREHSKDELAKISEEFMKEMGYEEQPYLVVFHDDTENNHVHIVSSRVDKNTGKKIDDSFEKLKSQKALAVVMENIYGVKTDYKIEKLLQYKFSTMNQLALLLERSGFRLSKNAKIENAYDILKNGVRQKTILSNQIKFNQGTKERKNQLKAILHKYQAMQSNKVFKVIDRREKEGVLPKDKVDENWKPKIEYQSELQHKLREAFGIDIHFHHSGDKMPFGYTLIDHKMGMIFKGSELFSMKDLFEFTNSEIDKRLFESIKDFNIQDAATKNVLLKNLNHTGQKNIEDFMLFENKKRKSKQDFSVIKKDVIDFIHKKGNEDIKLLRDEKGEIYAMHTRLHYIGNLRNTIGEFEFQKYINSETKTGEEEKLSNELSQSIKDLTFEIKKSSHGGNDPSEDELRKRKRKKRK